MPERFEYNDLTAGSEDAFNGDHYGAQTFTPQTAHTITSVKLYIRRYGTFPQWDFLLAIYLADAEHEPTGSPLCSSTKPASEIPTTPAWLELTLSPDDVWLQQDQEYVIQMSAPDAIPTNRPFATYMTTNPYPRGIRLYSDDAGENWTPRTDHDYSFEDWGEAAPPAPSIETLDATGIKSDQATLATKVTNDQGKTLSVRHNYGKTTDYGINTPWQEGKHTDDTITQLVTDLDPETLYHFRGEAVYED